jgi:hypothetical protein
MPYEQCCVEACAFYELKRATLEGNAMHWMDPDFLPEKKGKVTQFLVNPRGELEGLVLGRSTLVHFPSHLSRQIARHISVGSTICVRGVKPRNADVLAAVSLTSQDGVVITDYGPDSASQGLQPIECARKQGEAIGRVTLSLFGPKGDLRGALLESGTSLRMTPHAANELVDYLTPGVLVHAWGAVVKIRHGTTLDVESIAFGDE